MHKNKSYKAVLWGIGRALTSAKYAMIGESVYSLKQIMWLNWFRYWREKRKLLVSFYSKDLF